MSLYLGLDSSTQSLSAVVVEIAGGSRRVVLDTSIDFDDALPHYGTRHGVLPDANPSVAVSSPLMWAEALDLMMERLSHSGLDLRHLVAVSGSAQQHGSVYVRAEAAAGFGTLEPKRSLPGQIARLLARPVSPIWMDSSTSVQCAAIAAAVGGDAVLARHTGSRAFERFTGPQIRKFVEQDPPGYAATGRIHLVSSYLASLLCGADAPVDPGDASGTNLMDLATQQWWVPAVEATAPNLAARLPAIVPSSTVVGRLSAYWQVRHGLPAARVVAWSGDNPCSLIGVGLVREGIVAVSLGTSDTVFGLMRAPLVDPGGTGHVFGSPTGHFMGLTCFSNGSLARERVRDRYGLTWGSFSDALEATPPGNDGRLMLPWFDPEITPAVSRPAVHRHRLDPDDAAANVRALVEAQQMSMALHSGWMPVTIDTIYATGGGAANLQILQIMADVFGADVYRFDVANSAALGAALRAVHADAAADGHDVSWDDVVSGLAEPSPGSRLTPDPRRQGIYRDLKIEYSRFEESRRRGVGV